MYRQASSILLCLQPLTFSAFVWNLLLSTDPWVSHIGAENTLFSLHLQMEWWVLEMNMVLYSNSSVACLLEQTKQRNVVMRHLIKGIAFTRCLGWATTQPACSEHDRARAGRDHEEHVAVPVFWRALLGETESSPKSYAQSVWWRWWLCCHEIYWINLIMQVWQESVLQMCSTVVPSWRRTAFRDHCLWCSVAYGDHQESLWRKSKDFLSAAASGEIRLLHVLSLWLKWAGGKENTTVFFFSCAWYIFCMAAGWCLYILWTVQVYASRPSNRTFIFSL